jgi:NADH-quinone oxidoreductase subunit G
MLKNDAPNARYALNNSLKIAKGAGIYFHPIEDSVIKSLSKNIVTVAHKPLKEEAILYLVLKLFGKELPAKVVDYINSFDTKVKREVTETVKETIKEKVTGEDGKEQEVEKQVDKKVTKEIEVTISKLFEEAGVAENFEESLAKLLKKKDSFSLIAGADLITHPKAENLAKLLGLIDRYTDFFVLVIPPKTNSLGVSLICDLDEKEEGFVIGYNENGNFKLSSSGDGDLDMPALNQQEGTFVTVDKRVVPINVAVEYGGYILNDIAKCLGVSLNREYTIDYTKSLPVQSGFKPIDFDSLSNSFGNDQSDNRGYLLDTKECTASDEVSEIDGAELSGIVLYSANPISQFSHFTNSAEILKDSAKLFVTSEFLKNNSLEDGSLVKVNDFLELKLCLDSSISGNFAYLPNFDKTVDSESIFDNGYRFAQVNLKKV